MRARKLVSALVIIGAWPPSVANRDLSERICEAGICGEDFSVPEAKVLVVKGRRI
jgi:hypothetical protein